MASLEVLHLANNKLTHLPLDMSRLSRLGSLMINNNKFSAFPPVIPQITSLTSVSLAFNDGIKVPRTRLQA
jgi:Leucine-rich repeat (LRR) protein